MLILLGFSCFFLSTLLLFCYFKIQKLNLNLSFKTQNESNLQQQLQQLLCENKHNQEKYHQNQQNLSEISAKYTYQQEALMQKQQELNQTKQQHELLQQQNLKLQIELQENITKLQITAQSNIKWQETLELQFSHIVTQNSEKLTTLNQQKISEILAPFNQDLHNLQNKIETANQQSIVDREVLKEKIHNLFEHTNKISVEANNLSSALKGNNKIQGNWGEMLLEQILQHSGLQKDLHYKKELTLQNEEGKNLRPDFQIFLPDGSIIITDSKVSLNAYNEFIATNHEKHLKDHINSVEQHIKNLAKKEYAQNVKQALDFTIAFIPVEPAYLLAIQHNQQLWFEAYEKKILLTSPTNFVICLKIIHDIWQRYKREENYQQIVSLADSIYEKSVAFLENLEEIGKAIKKADNYYNLAQKKITEGKGNLVQKLHTLKDIGGLNSNKKIPENFLQKDFLPDNTISNL
jgi:DNA recombination protein RmuC